MSMSSRPDSRRIPPVILLAPFMGSLDGSIVDVALPTNVDRLRVGLDCVQGVISSYLIVISALVLALGKMAEKRDKVGMFEHWFLSFGTGSMLCSAACSLPILIPARSVSSLSPHSWPGLGS